MNSRTGNAKGKAAESRAARHLLASGFEIIARNFRCRQGEIDLVARQGSTLVFVEVRCRSGRSVSAAESVDRRKRQRLVQAALYYLALHPTVAPCRFDVICITGDPEAPGATVDHIAGAFTLSDL